MVGEVGSWQEGKSEAIAFQDALVELIPEDAIEDVSQGATGTLLRCGEDRHRWKGSTTITVRAGHDIDEIVRRIEEGPFPRESSVAPVEEGGEGRQIQISTDRQSENYIVGLGFEANEIRIDAGSPCFTLPEGVWPRGEF